MQHLQKTKPQETSESGEVIVLPPVQVRRRTPAFARRMNDFLQRLIPALLGLGLLVLLWQLAAINSKGFPTPLSTLDSAMTLFADPFYRDGPNDMGIGWNVLASLQRVAIGFGLAALAGIPLGFLIGRFTFFSRMFSPLIALLRPVSPLAWLPIGLLLFQKAEPASSWTIFICSIWPMVINTAEGVRRIPQDYLNVARVLQLSEWTIMRRILFPAVLPAVLTGVRLSIGIAWLVIVAAEMLTGGLGIGFWIWNEWNNLNVENILIAIVIIGVVGLLLEQGLMLIARRFSWQEKLGVNMKPLIQVQAVSQRFSTASGEFLALQNVSFDIHEGETVSLIGHSGCGKSTLLNLIAGITLPTEGGLICDNREIAGPGPERAVVFQNHSLLPWLTCFDNVALAVDQVFRHTMSKAERKEWIEHNLDRVQMGHALHKRPGEISGGMKQRVGIARALAMKPKVLLMDEPFGALDALTRAHLQDSVMQIQQALNTTIVLITHDVDEAVLLSDRVLMMTNGPAATVGEILRVDLPRPRNRVQLADDSRYHHMRQQILHFLYEKQPKAA